MPDTVQFHGEPRVRDGAAKRFDDDVLDARVEVTRRFSRCTSGGLGCKHHVVDTQIPAFAPTAVHRVVAEAS